MFACCDNAKARNCDRHIDIDSSNYTKGLELY